jgi:hypothetical protein
VREMVDDENFLSRYFFVVLGIMFEILAIDALSYQ